MKNNFLVILSIFCLCLSSYAQQSFPEKCQGIWKGTMYIMGKGQIRDSVDIVFTVAKMDDGQNWTWRKEYLSEKRPMTKDYVLRLHDEETKVYLTDEGNDIVLYDYVFENKMYSVFETGGFLLTSTYELRGEELIFEVSSGKLLDAEKKEVNNYSVNFVQRVVFRREK